MDKDLFKAYVSKNSSKHLYIAKESLPLSIIDIVLNKNDKEYLTAFFYIMTNTNMEPSMQFLYYDFLAEEVIPKIVKNNFYRCIKFLSENYHKNNKNLYVLNRLYKESLLQNNRKMSIYLYKEFSIKFNVNFLYLTTLFGSSSLIISLLRLDYPKNINDILRSCCREHKNDAVKYIIDNNKRLKIENGLIKEAINSNNLNLVKYLKHKGVNINMNNGILGSNAGKKGYVDILKFLLENGYKPKYLTTLLYKSLVSDNLDVYLLIQSHMKKYDIYVEDANIFRECIISGSEDIAEYIFSKASVKNQTDILNNEEFLSLSIIYNRVKIFNLYNQCNN